MSECRTYLNCTEVGEDVFASIIRRNVTKALGLIPRLDFSSDCGHFWSLFCGAMWFGWVNWGCEAVRVDEVIALVVEVRLELGIYTGNAAHQGRRSWLCMYVGCL